MSNFPKAMYNKKILVVIEKEEYIKKYYIPYLKKLKEKGYEIHIATNGDQEIKYGDKYFNISFSKNLISIKNIKAYIRLLKIINKNKYNVIYCENLICGIITRLAARLYRKKNNKITKVIYMVYRLGFYKGANIKKWIIHYPIEKILARYTDILITINKQDYEFAKSKLKIPKINLINGIGIDQKKLKVDLTENEKKSYYKEFDLQPNDYIFLSIGDLDKNQNQIMQIDGIRRLKRKFKNVKLLIVGEGKLEEYYYEVIEKYDLAENIKLLGKREDILKLLKFCDCLITTTKQEDFPISLIEAMFLKVPLIATDIIGHREFIDRKNLVNLKSTDDLVKNMENMMIRGRKKINYNIQKYRLERVLMEMEKIM